MNCLVLRYVKSLWFMRKQPVAEETSVQMSLDKSVSSKHTCYEPVNHMKKCSFSTFSEEERIWRSCLNQMLIVSLAQLVVGTLLTW